MFAIYKWLSMGTTNGVLTKLSLTNVVYEKVKLCSLIV